MNDPTAIIFDIQRSSYVDGPGIRTTVFFKGCNLRCAWCHNPESQEPKPQMMFHAGKCTGCGTCERVCMQGGVVNRKFTNRCVRCLRCAANCPRGAISHRNRLPMRLYLKKKPTERAEVYL